MEMPERTRRNKNKKRGLATAKVVMVGDACVGKTSLMSRYMERQYVECTNTIGAAFVIKTWGIHDIAIWDTAGEEKYAGMTTFYYRNASAAILTFDMFDRTSFYNLSHRYIPILNDVASAQLKVIVANKSDLLGTHQRQIIGTRMHNLFFIY
ncbi:unnamed protein product [Larinioides sclopetarius]|uniref:Uncharacterized protein n=1 Tax=Larinioides sclopetarius TaxID=280406 RepID=A0AAV2A5M9_9ARAC